MIPPSPGLSPGAKVGKPTHDRLIAEAAGRLDAGQAAAEGVPLATKGGVGHGDSRRHDTK